MRVHHLDCASLCPFGGSAIRGEGPLFARTPMPAHCVLIETAKNGLVAIDTGLGEEDLRAPHARLGGLFTTLMGVDPTQRPVTTLAGHVRRLGFARTDVRHIVLTHLDLDHAGGLADFPQAEVHVHADEHAAAMRPTFRETHRYRPAQWAHGPRWKLYRHHGETWRGFDSVHALGGLPEELLALPLPGHTRGHACIAIDGARPLVHAGDAYFHRSALEGGATPWGLRAFESFLAADRQLVTQNHARLRDLAAGGSVRVFSAHDPVELSRLRGS